MFLPTTKKELETLGWSRPDIILVTGDSYIDSPYIGVALIGKLLLSAGFKTAIIAQPDITSPNDITRLGEPALFWGVTGGCVDSMVANYTATRKKRKSDDYTPGGINNRRPDRAVIRYSNLIRNNFKPTVPIVLGGIEASLRRICHYDFWSDKIRKSILFDAKADFLIYGMGEHAIIEIAQCISSGKSPEHINGLCYISKQTRNNYIELPTFDEVASDKNKFIEMFHLFYNNNDPLTAKGLYQKHDSRYLIQNPPPAYMTTKELDTVYEMPFERDLHPYYKKHGTVKALDTIRFSIPAHRGCYGECNFCAISVHQGRTVRSRSEASIVNEAESMTRHPEFKGIITDTGGPTANMYGFECKKKLTKGACSDKRCLFPEVCSSLRPSHGPLTRLLTKIRQIPAVKRVFTASGIRYDIIFADKKQGLDYLRQIIKHHVSGQLKIAPEHTETSVLKLMGKPGSELLTDFKSMFDSLSLSSSKKQYLTYYFIAAYPGCTESDMKHLKQFAGTTLRHSPEQVQIFTPTPSTYASVMYYTETDPFSGKRLFVEKHQKGRERQKQILTLKPRNTNQDQNYKKKFRKKGPQIKRKVK